jgi:pimeloyl-[acyl-carrier protein] synthase
MTMPAAPHWFNPFLPRYRDDPHPLLHRLRAEEPVHFSELADVWFLTRYADVQAALTNDRQFTADSRHWDQHARHFRRPTDADAAAVYSRWMLQMDPPDHTRLRVLLNGAFTPRVVLKLRETIRSICHKLLKPILERGKGDVLQTVAYPLPIIVICELLGVPEDGRARVKQWSAEMIPSLNPGLGVEAAKTANAAVHACGDYFRSLLHLRREHPTEDLISRLAAAREGGHQLTDDELVATCLLLAFAGHYTTVQLIGGMVLLMIQNSDQFQRVRVNASLRTSAVEESLRCVTPLQFVFRATKAPVEIGGVRIPANQLVFPALVAANRDPAVFPDPDRFDVARSHNKHLAFGHGIHYCAGAGLARLEAEVVLETLCEHATALHLSGAVRRESSLLFRGLDSLPLEIERA